MPHQLYLVKGTTYLSLTGDGVQLSHFVPTPMTPKAGTEDDYEPVQESIDLLLYGSTTTEVQDKLHALQQMVLDARRRQNEGVGDRVFLQYQPINDTVAWSAEVFDGVDPLGDSAMTAWSQRKVQLKLQVQRGVFEAPLVEARLANKTQSFALGGQTIYNCDDSRGGNWVETIGVTGVCATPAKIVLTNNTGAGQYYRRIYVAGYAFPDSNTFFAHMLQGENTLAGWGSSVASTAAVAANNAYGQINFTSSGGFRFTLPQTLLNAARGKRFRLLTRFVGYSITAPIYVQAQLLDRFGVIALQEDMERMLPSGQQELNDIGELALPAAGWTPNCTPHTLALNFRAPSATVNLDFLQLTPADNLRVLLMRGGYVGANESVIDDGPERLTYLQDSGGAHFVFSVKGSPLRLRPGKTNRIFVLADEGLSAAPGNTFKMQLFYRPRRPTV